MEHIWTVLMHKILQNHLLCAFVANFKIGAIYALYPESFCDKNLAIRKVFAFCDSAQCPERLWELFLKDSNIMSCTFTEEEYCVSEKKIGHNCIQHS